MIRIFPSLSILFLLLAGACGPKGPGSKLEISSSFSIGADEGGLLLYMHNRTTNQSRSVAMASGSTSIVLENGNWDFTAVAWRGNAGPYSGTMECGNASAELKGPDVAVTLDINAANCNSDAFAPTSFRSSGNINPLNLVTCSTFPAGLISGTYCNPNNAGATLGYKIRFLEFNETAGQAPGPSSPGLLSGCILANTSPTVNPTVTPAAISVPYGNPNEKFAVVVETYTNASCTLGQRSYYFPKGFAYASSPAAATKVFSTATTSDVYVQHGGLKLTAASFTFPAGTVVNTTSSDKTITLTNQSPDPIVLDSVGVTGPFSVTALGTTCVAGYNLLASNTCEIKVAFSPVSTTLATNNLVVTYGGGSVVQETLQGTGQAPALLEISGDTGVFGSLAQGGTTTQTFTITNNGASNATVVTRTVNPGDGFSVTSPACPTTIAPGATCNVVVELNRSALGSKSSSFTYQYHDGETTQTLPQTLSATINTTASLAISGSASFGPKIVSEAAASSVITVTNSGGSPATITSFSALASPFTVSPNACTVGTVLAATNGSCQFTVSESNASAGTFASLLTIGYDNGATPVSVSESFSVAVNSRANLVLSLGSGAFGTLISGATPAVRTITLKNTGDSTATLNTVNVPAPFTKSNDLCSAFSLPKDQTCTFDLGLSTATPGIYTPNVTLTYSDTLGSRPNFSMPLSTDIKAPAVLNITGSSNMGTFAQKVANADAVFTVTHSGPIPATSLGFSVLPTTPFTVVSDGCTGVEQSSGSQCQFTIRLDRTNLGDPFGSSFSFTYHNGVSVQTITTSLSATVKPVGNLSFTGTNSFTGKIESSPDTVSSIMVTNDGGSPITITNVGALAAPFAIQNSTCDVGDIINVGDSCGFDIVATHNNVGTFSQNLPISYNNGSTVDVLNVATSLNVDPRGKLVVVSGTGEFGTQTQLVAATDKTITLRNTGSINVTVGSFPALTPPFGLAANGCESQTITPGTTCSFNFTLDTTSWSVSPYTETLNFNYTDSVGAQTFSAIANATINQSGALSFSTVDFGEVFQGATPGPISVTITNNGGSTSIAFPSDPAGYTVSNIVGCAPIGGGGATCSFDLTLTDTTTVGSMNRTMTFTYGGGSTASLSVFGGVKAPAFLAFSGYDFLDVLNFGTKTRSVVITNTGGVAISSVSPSIVGAYTGVGDFAVSGSCPSPFNPGATCTLTMTFSPTATGIRTADLNLSYFDGVSAQNTVQTFQGNSRNAALLSYVDTTELALGNIVFGAIPPTKTIRITNQVNAFPAVLGTINLGAPFQYVGGPYPGTAGNCGSSLNPGATCTIEVAYNPTSAGTHSVGLVIDYDADGNGANDSSLSSTNLTGTALSPANLQLSIVTGSYDFGPYVIGNTSPVMTYRLTNTGGAPATSLDFSSVTTPFSRGGPCSGSLAGGGSTCDFTVTYSPATFGEHNFTLSVGYNNGLSGQQVQQAITANAFHPLAVNPHYTNAPNWNDYVSGGAPNVTYPSPSQSVCSSQPCYHGGEVRRATLSGAFSSCTNLTAQDSENALEWKCFDNAGTISFLSLRLKEGKGLRQLVNSSAWKPLKLQVFSSGILASESAPVTWWGNAVVPLDSLASVPATGTVSDSFVQSYKYNSEPLIRSFMLIGASTIYTINTNLSVPAFVITAPKAALVTRDGVLLNTTNTASQASCDNDGVNVGAPNRPAGLCSNQPYLWLEIKHTPVDSNNRAFYLFQTRHNRIHRSEFATSKGGHLKSALATNTVYESVFRNGSDTGLVIDSSAGTIVKNSSFIRNAIEGVEVLNSGSTVIIRGHAAGNSANGVLITGSNNSVIYDVRSSNNGFSGVRIQSTSDAKVVRLLASQNAQNGLALALNSTKATVVSSGFYNNGASSSGTGILVQGTGAHTLINNSISNSYVGLSIGASNTKVNYLISAHNESYNLQTLSTFTGNLIDNLHSSNGAADCQLLSSTTIGGLPSTITGACPNKTAINLSGTFVGLVTADSQNTQVSGGGATSYANVLENFIGFQNSFRFWGPAGTTELSSSSRGICSAGGGTCSAWDWRIDSADTAIRSLNGLLAEGSPCPAAISGSQATVDQQTTANTFMVSAVEELGDGIGDEDGLCETNESCLYSPNYGPYLGEGPVGQCNFQNGTISNVSMRGFTFSPL